MKLWDPSTLKAFDDATGTNWADLLSTVGQQLTYPTDAVRPLRVTGFRVGQADMSGALWSRLKANSTAESTVASVFTRFNRVFESKKLFESSVISAPAMMARNATRMSVALRTLPC